MGSCWRPGEKVPNHLRSARHQDRRGSHGAESCPASHRLGVDIETFVHDALQGLGAGVIRDRKGVRMISRVRPCVKRRPASRRSGPTGSIPGSCSGERLVAESHPPVRREPCELHPRYRP